MKSTLCIAALAAVATLALSGCVTGGMDAETKAALRATMESVQELTDLWQERLDALDDDGGDAPDDTPPVVTTGSVELIGTPVRRQYTDVLSGANRLGWDLGGWGMKGVAADGATLFTATLNGTSVLGGPSNDPFFDLILGLRSFDNPEGYGTATWTGTVRGYETIAATFGTPVEGTAELEVDLDSVLDRVDVDFTDFERGHADMSWRNVFVSLGSFRSFLYGDLEGRFYGDEHEGVAGTFERDDLKGIFGAVRE